MTDYLTEQEQIELIKNWFKQYIGVIILGILFAALAVYGWHYWQDRQSAMRNDASMLFDELLTARAQNNTTTLEKQGQGLISQYPKTVYSTMGALTLARTAIISKNYSKATHYLNWVLENGNVPALQQIARLRLARILLAQNKYEEGLKTLATVNDATFNGLINEVKGDIYYRMQKISQARAAYQEALTQLPNAQVVRPLLQMKYDNLAV